MHTANDQFEACLIIHCYGILYGTGEDVCTDMYCRHIQERIETTSIEYDSTKYWVKKKKKKKKKKYYKKRGKITGKVWVLYKNVIKG